ncbi:hypothetical protein AVEN_236586-1 [Araneus ventricosus]|uniref:Uncharacterized protein n=1 Tax=Araneus ventricosus TaxID=182803 RepID=A0A4Y2J407_ARAVE|nr:hypothetical protein AVEN_236586-1 [Araneus ventricosus]
MTRAESFGKAEERFASQQETRFSVRFPQACFRLLKKVKSLPSADKIEPPFPPSEAVLLQRGPTPLFSPPLQSRTPKRSSPSSDVILEISEMSIRNLN